VREAAAGTNVRVLDAQDVPENFAPVVARDDCLNVVFIDAVAADGEAGTVVFGPLADFKEASSLTTHKLALSLSARFLEEAGKKVFLLGVVPGDMSFGEGFTPEVAAVAAMLRDLIRRTLRGPSY
jgi:hydrogenase maturation protease